MERAAAAAWVEERHAAGRPTRERSVRSERCEGALPSPSDATAARPRKFARKNEDLVEVQKFPSINLYSSPSQEAPRWHRARADTVCGTSKCARVDPRPLPSNKQLLAPSKRIRENMKNLIFKPKKKTNSGLEEIRC